MRVRVAPAGGQPRRRGVATAREAARVQVRRGTRRRGIDTPRLREAARLAVAVAGRHRSVELVVLLGGDRLLRRLNRRFRGVDRPTDVLSFPDGEGDADGRRRLGDIAISVEAAAAQARAAGWSLGEVLDRLVVHGVLHLLGYDHERDAGEMMALQGRILRRLRRERQR
jgi:rRNA maturation RNase YbeY